MKDGSLPVAALSAKALAGLYISEKKTDLFTK